MQGTAALAFVRQRHGLPAGDLDRVKRQQAFLRGAADKILSVGTLTNPTKLNDLINAVDRSVVFDKGFDVLTFAEQITDLSSGNINFETLPTTGSETSTDKDALATDPAQVKAFFQGIVGGTGTSGEPATSARRPTVDPAAITVDINDGTIADGVTAHASELANDAGFKLGSLGVIAGTRKGNEQSTTEFHYSGDEAGAQQVQSAFGGIGKLVNDASVKAGHVLVLVGTDLEVPSGLRGAGAAFAAAPRLFRRRRRCRPRPSRPRVRSLCQLSEACRANRNTERGLPSERSTLSELASESANALRRGCLTVRPPRGPQAASRVER